MERRRVEQAKKTKKQDDDKQHKSGRQMTIMSAFESVQGYGSKTTDYKIVTHVVYYILFMLP